MDTPSPIGTILDSADRSSPWPASLRTARPPLPRAPRIAKSATVSPRVLLTVPGNPSTTPLLARALAFQLHPISVWIHIYGGEKLGVIIHPAFFGATLSAGTPHSVCLFRSRPLRAVKGAESVKREIRSACFVFNRRDPKTALDLAERSLLWRGELLGQNRALQGRH